MKNLTLAAVLLLPAAALVVASAGCDKSGDASADRPDKRMFTDDRRPMINDIMDAYADAGAADDGLLYARHFTDGQLNSLGRDKLAAVVRGSGVAGPVQVNVDLAEGDAMKGQRLAAVRQYLDNAGVDAARVKVVDGPNPDKGTRVDPMFESATDGAAESGE